MQRSIVQGDSRIRNIVRNVHLALNYISIIRTSDFKLSAKIGSKNTDHWLLESRTLLHPGCVVQKMLAFFQKILVAPMGGAFTLSITHFNT